MTIYEASRLLRTQLSVIYEEREADNIAELVMENISGLQRMDRVINKTIPLTTPQAQVLANYTTALLNNTPLQYVLHEAWFYEMLLYVDENVLIPRPETEELVDWLIRDAGNWESGIGNRALLDIGTGSGCIPLAVKKNIPAIDVHACDISTAALAVAKKNAANQQLIVQFHLLDILSATACRQLPVFDIIISNPPYIPQKDKLLMAANVLQYEPHLALFVKDNDPLLFYRAIANFAGTNLHQHGALYLEIHEDMGAAIVDLYKQKGFNEVLLKKDLQGKDRMLRVSKV